MPNRLILPLAMAVMVTACAGTRQVEVPTPVEVPGPTRYVPVPADLLADCDGRPEPLGPTVTGRVLLETAKAWERWAACMDGRRAAIRSLSTAPAGENNSH